MMQSANKLPRWVVLGLAFPLAVLNGWLLLLVLQYFQPLVNVFVAALLLAFVLEYPIRFLQQQKVKRNNAVVAVSLVALLILVGLGLTLVPIIWQQLNELANILPSWIDSGRQQLQAFQIWSETQQLPINLGGIVTQLTDRLSSQLQNVTGRILNFAFDTIGSAVNVLLTVVLTFYLILNGDRLWDGIFKWFPASFSSQVRQALREDFHNYFIGQATFAAWSGCVITLAFLALRVPLGLLFGIAIGFLALFPFGAGIGISIVSLLVALQNFWLGVEVLAVAAAIDQINANFIAPRILGGFTGLNPVWILLSLLIGAKLGGLLGLLIAVPLASFIKSTADSLRDGKWNEIEEIESEPTSLNVSPVIASKSLASDAGS
ncbi:AI-2E family transporter [Trichocoleus sp. DQ-A2]|nr:AI-2E family transporter [Coleofasciculus sp. FACHB-T130]